MCMFLVLGTREVQRDSQAPFLFVLLIFFETATLQTLPNTYLDPDYNPNPNPASKPRPIVRMSASVSMSELHVGLSGSRMLQVANRLHSLCFAPDNIAPANIAKHSQTQPNIATWSQT